MATAVIIAEYNPLHNGHKFHIAETRRISGAENIAVVMSGNFVQRGEPAIFNKYERAAHAILCGADIVIELPCLYSLSSAAYFAKGAVQVAALIKNTEYLSFGSECGDIAKLNNTAILTDSNDYSQALQKSLDRGLSYTAASQKARQALNSLTAMQPNDTLGIEYIKALAKYAPYIKPLTITRRGDYHSNSLNEINIECAENRGEFASASAIRSAIADKDTLINHVPLCTLASLHKVSNILNERLFAVIATQINNGFEEVYEDNEGLINRVKKALISARTYQELIDLSHTKRYTKSRIRRFLMHIALKQTPLLLQSPIDYTRVLAVNADKKYLLSDVKNIISDTDLYANDIYADRVYELVTASDRLRNSPLFINR